MELEGTHHISCRDIMSALLLALELAEKEQLQHACRVTYVAMRLAERVGLSPADLENMYLAAMLHDIGITGRFGELESEPESEPVRQHPLKGKGIVDRLSFPCCGEAGKIIACHHERWDGKGYPAGSAARRSPWPPASSSWPRKNYRWGRASSPWPTCTRPSPLTAPTAIV